MANSVGTALRPALAAMEQRIRDRWVTVDLQLLTPVLLRFAEKSSLICAGSPGTMRQEPDNAPWLIADVVWGQGNLTSIGGGAQNLVVGYVQLMLHYPKIYTPAPGLGLIDFIDKARAIFDNWEGSSLRFQAASGPQNADELDPTNKWKVRLVTIDFDLHECAS